VRWLSGLPGHGIPRSSGKWPSETTWSSISASTRTGTASTSVPAPRVEAIERIEDGWAVRAGGETYPAGRVVVATGTAACRTSRAGRGTFGGELVHSSAYRRGDPYRDSPGAGRRRGKLGRRDRARRRARRCEPGPALREDAARPRPAGHARHPSQLLGVASARLPVGAVDRIAATLRRAAFGDLSELGLAAPDRPYSEFLRRRVIPIVDVGLVRAVKDGRVAVVAALERFDDGSPCSPTAAPSRSTP
jgi:putative flavoprotein involved in K+ transport